MVIKAIACAALVAWFSTSALVAAQDPEAETSTTARLAAAALAEARGDLVAAQRELAAALAAASGGERAEVERALAALRQRQGLADEQEAPVREVRQEQDPVERLVRAIDRGATTDKDVHEAWVQLEQLGALAVPPLLQALPRLGPFGMHNALELLVRQDDARVRAALGELLAKQDPAVAATIAELLSETAAGNRRAVAEQLVATGHAPSVRIRGFRVLTLYESDQNRLPELARQLLETKALHGGLLDAAQASHAPWAELVLTELAERGDAAVRSSATATVLLRTEDLDEDRALAALATMAEPYRTETATALVRERRTWVRVGLIALATYDAWRQPWFERMEWWRRPDEAVGALLALPVEAFVESRVYNAITEIVRSGWRMPPELESAFERIAKQGAWSIFVAALPDDAEARAVAVWERSGPNDRHALVGAVVGQGRPWHQLVVRQLAEDPKAVPIEWLQRDWRGSSGEAMRQLATLVARWHAQPLTAPAAKAGTSTYDWRQVLCEAFQAQPALPLDVIQPLLQAEDYRAWLALADRDAMAALDAAARWQDLSIISGPVLDLAARHGDRRHLELVVKAVRRRYANNEGVSASIDTYLKTFGSGAPVVIALGKQNGRDHQSLERTARTAARCARVPDLDELLAMAPELSLDCATDLIGTLATQLRAQHAPSVQRALSASIEAALSPEECAAATALGRIHPKVLSSRLLRCSVGLHDEGVVPLSRKLLARSDDPHLLREAARACIALAREGRPAILAELLADPRPAVVNQALAAKDLRDDTGLREQAIAAILRHAGKIESLDMLVDNLLPDDQTALAQRLLEDARLPQFSIELCSSLLEAVGNRKDGRFVSQLANATGHPEEPVRRHAAQALGRTFAKEAVPILLELLKDDSDAVRKQATSSLEAIAHYLDAQKQWQERLK